MALVAALAPLASSHVGDLQATVATLASLTGLQEPEPGWLLCNNAKASRATYAALFAEVGFAYSPTPGQDPADGTFYLPYLIEGVSPIAKGQSAFTTTGARGGEITHTLSLAELGQHIHNWSASYNYVDVIGGILDPGPDFGTTDTLVFVSPWATSSNGGGGAHNNMHPYQVVEGYLIKY